MGSPHGPQGRRNGFSLGFLLIAGLLIAGCINKDGETLPPGLMTFPIAISLNTRDTAVEPEYVYVANSNFALQFNTGTLQSYDLTVMNAALDSTGEFTGIGCAGAGFLNICLQRTATNGVREACVPELGGEETRDCNCLPEVSDDCIPCACDPNEEQPDGLQCDPVPPDRCSVLPTQLALRDQGALLATVIAPGLLVSEVQIGSFADGIALSSNEERIYLPVRSNSNLTWVDVDDGVLDCGADPDEPGVPSCSPEFRSNASIPLNPDAPDPIELPEDPVDIFADDVASLGVTGVQGDYVIMAHREAEASLFLDLESEGEPRLIATLDELSPEQVTVTVDPRPTGENSGTAWISSQLTNQISRVGIGISDSDLFVSSLSNGGTLFVTGLDTGNSMRDIQFPSSDSELVYLLSRSPESLVVARRGFGGNQLNVVDQVSVCEGPSRLKLVELETRSGETVLTAFVSCFDQRQIQIIDLELLQSITVLTNISGAFEFVVDVSRERIYIADFSISVLRVADLSPMIDCLEAPGGAGNPTSAECAPVLVGLVGLPQPVSEFPR